MKCERYTCVCSRRIYEHEKSELLHCESEDEKKQELNSGGSKCERASSSLRFFHFHAILSQNVAK